MCWPPSLTLASFPPYWALDRFWKKRLSIFFLIDRSTDCYQKYITFSVTMNYSNFVYTTRSTLNVTLQNEVYEEERADDTKLWQKLCQNTRSLFSTSALPLAFPTVLWHTILIMLDIFQYKQKVKSGITL